MASVSTVASIHSLPPELFPTIANELPLADRPLALLSLAVASRQISEILLPSLLYEQVIIQTQRGLVSAVDILCRRADIRVRVRGLYVRAFLVLGQDGKYPAMTKLGELFRVHRLPGLHTVYLRLGTHLGDPFHAIEPLDEMFWVDLSTCCPNLRNIGFDHHLFTESLKDRERLFPWGRHSHLSHFKVLRHSLREVWGSDCFLFFIPECHSPHAIARTVNFTR
jgi:hypothetical protein